MGAPIYWCFHKPLKYYQQKLKQIYIYRLPNHITLNLSGTLTKSKAKGVKFLKKGRILKSGDLRGP